MGLQAFRDDFGKLDKTASHIYIYHIFTIQYSFVYFVHYKKSYWGLNISVSLGDSSVNACYIQILVQILPETLINIILSMFNPVQN